MSMTAHPGARIMFTFGKAHLMPVASVPPEYDPAVASIISPGTELRRMAATATGPEHPAGYMTLAVRHGRGFALAAAPHGAAVAPDDPTALPVPAGTCTEHVAIARFQVMAALGLARFRDLIRGSQR